LSRKREKLARGGRMKRRLDAMLTFHDRFLKQAGGLYRLLWLAAAFYTIPALDALAQAPPNDDLASAQAIDGFSGVVYGDNLNATAQTNEPPPYINPAQASIWYLWTAPITTRM